MRLHHHQRLGRENRLRHGEIRDLVARRTRAAERIGQHLIDQAEEMPLALLDARQIGALIVGQRAVHFHLHEARIAADGVERCSQLMA